jgi:long-chain acyl-CoA synthetase
MTAAILYQQELIPGAELERRAACAAAGLERAGVGEGDVVALMLKNEPAYLEAILACRRLGAYSCPVNWHFKADEVGYILRDSGAKVLVINADLLPQIENAHTGTRVLVSTEWAGWRDSHAPWAGTPRAPRGSMPYTSGTTGRPKGVRRNPLSDEQVKLNAEANRLTWGIEPGMRALCSAPLYHSAPVLYATQTALSGDLLVLEPRFDAERTLQLIEQHALTHAYLVPTMYVRMLRLPKEVRQRYDLASMRFVASTGSPCAPEVKRAMLDWWGPVLYEAYASSETGALTLATPADATDRPGCAGRPLPGVRMAIYDDEGRKLPPGEVGTIYARNPAYPDFTYSNNPQARAALERDGLWSVGDMGYLDEAGRLIVCDRKSDMVISGGVNIYPAEIEAALVGMPGVADSAVFGIPDAEFGEALAVAVQPLNNKILTAQEVQAWLRKKIADYKVPKVVTFHDALPREDSGKIFKRRLREPYWKDAGRKI